MANRRIDLKIGFECNNMCKFCVQGSKRYEYAPKTRDELFRDMEEGRKESDEIVFTGGEPTIRKDLPQLVERAKSLGYKLIQIQTNGRMFSSKAFCETLIAAGANEFSPAIHGPSPEIHDSLTCAKGAFAQTVKGIINLKELGQRVIMNSVITKPNHTFLPATALLFVKLKVDQYQFAFVHALGSAKKNFEEIVPRYSELEPYLKKGLDIGVAHGVRVMTEAVPLCVLTGGYEKYAAEFVMPQTKIFDAKWIIEDYTVYRHTEGKLKGPKCNECLYFGFCEGPWREYPETFGFDEFKPVKK